LIAVFANGHRFHFSNATFIRAVRNQKKLTRGGRNSTLKGAKILDQSGFIGQ